MAKAECLRCEHLIQHCKEVPVKRTDGTNETAVWYECGRDGSRLTTMTKYDTECAWFHMGAKG